MTAFLNQIQKRLLELFDPTVIATQLAQWMANLVVGFFVLLNFKGRLYVSVKS